MTAVLTNSDMEFDVNTIDFKHCTINESVRTSIKLTNMSILPQAFGFVGHPDVSVITTPKLYIYVSN